jgi:hypothetical protein
LFLPVNIPFFGRNNFRGRQNKLVAIAIYRSLAGLNHHRWEVKLKEGSAIIDPPSSDRKG